MLGSPSFQRFSFLFLLLTSLVLAGCSVFQPAEPTSDPQVVMLSIVQTMQADLTRTALALPTETDIPTETPVPSPTLSPTPAFTATPSITPTPELPALKAEFLYAATYPENKTQYVPNEAFGLALGFKNIGSLAWVPGYKILITNQYSDFTGWPEASMNKYVATGEKVEFNIAGFGSEGLGMHTWIYQLYTDTGVPSPGWGGLLYLYSRLISELPGLPGCSISPGWIACSLVGVAFGNKS